MQSLYNPSVYQNYSSEDRSRGDLSTIRVSILQRRFLARVSLMLKS